MHLSFFGAFLAFSLSAAGDKVEDFRRDGGGIWKTEDEYSEGSARSINTFFWNYWIETEKEEVRSLYVSDEYFASTTAENRACLLNKGLRSCEMNSVEHIVPKSWPKGYITDTLTRNGATTNPLNWLPAGRGINSLRGNRKYDLEDDAVVRERLSKENRGPGVPAAFDADGEFVVIPENRGSLARAVLYMYFTYDLTPSFTPGDLQTLATWSVENPPAAWEQRYVAAVKQQYNISNPFVAHPATWEAALLQVGTATQAPAVHETAAPNTQVPATQTPESGAPETTAPPTGTPSTASPATGAPPTAAPVTDAPEMKGDAKRKKISGNAGALVAMSAALVGGIAFATALFCVLRTPEASPAAPNYPEQAA